MVMTMTDAYAVITPDGTLVAERLRQVRGGPAEGIDGRAYQAAVLAEQIDREEGGA